MAIYTLFYLGTNRCLLCFNEFISANLTATSLFPKISNCAEFSFYFSDITIYIYIILYIRYLLWEVMLIQFVNIYLISMRYYCFFYFNFCYRQILALFNEVKQTLMYGIIVFNTFHIYIIWHVIGITHNLIYGILIKINLAVLVQV